MNFLNTDKLFDLNIVTFRLSKEKATHLHLRYPKPKIRLLCENSVKEMYVHGKSGCTGGHFAKVTTIPYTNLSRKINKLFTCIANQKSKAQLRKKLPTYFLLR